MSKPEIKVVPDAAALYSTAVHEFQSCAQMAIAAQGRFSVALSGGNTPRGVYSLLAEKHKDDLPWDKIHIFFGDERHVPPTNPESNYRMANESLLSKVPILEQNVYRVRAELPADEAAGLYDRQLREFSHLQGDAWPRLDLVFLGIGEDGHTASLFPGSSALQETSRRVVANWVEKFQSFRITMTYPVLNQAANIVFLVSGQSKAEILRAILKSETEKSYPAQGIRPQRGRLLWIADQDAAKLL